MTSQVFIKNRNISFALRTVLDVMEISDRKKLNGFLMLIDFQKAFDMVNHKFMLSTLSKFNFGESFIAWIETFYNDISSCVLNNQFTSEYFQVNNRVRQGDPLSPYLFIMVVEIMAIAIRENKEIKGIKVKGENIKLVQYADDTTVFLNDVKSGKIFLQLLEEFSKCSGLKINIDKTEGLWLGQSKNKNEQLFGISWSKKPIKLLGLYIGHNKKNLEISNFRHKIQKLKGVLNSWKSRNLSLIGKILIVKTLALSQFRHLAQVIQIPDYIVKEIQEIITKFIWGGKQNKVKKNVMIQNYDLGGIRMEDFQTTIKVEQLKWIKNYLNNIDGKWKYTMEECIGEENVSLLLLSNYDIRYLRKCTPFYRDILDNWSIIKCKDNLSDTGLANQMIFYNRNLCVDNKMLYNKNIMSAGIWYIKDLFIDRNQLISKNNVKNRGLCGNDLLLLNTIISLTSQFRKKIIFINQMPCNACVQIDGECKNFLKMNTKVIVDVYRKKNFSTSKL